jgi:hypothetical protein
VVAGTSFRTERYASSSLMRASCCRYWCHVTSFALSLDTTGGSCYPWLGGNERYGMCTDSSLLDTCCLRLAGHLGLCKRRVWC